MRALALVGVFVVAKLVILAGRPIQLSGWTPIAYLWQDLLVGLTFALLDRIVKRAWFGWTVYGVAVAYVTINVGVERVLSSPLTWPMLGAAGGALSDSIKRHATPANFALMSIVVAAGLAFPLLLRRVRMKSRSALIIPALLLVPIGPLASSRVETIGLDRNPIMVLATSALPRIWWRSADGQADEDWRVSPVFVGGGDRFGEELSRWRGSTAGRNVVLILLESAGAEYLQPYGAIRDPMPNLSELARGAIVFDSAYAVYPESIKELFSVLCSRYPAMDTASESYSWITTPSLAAVLSGAGYRTALFHSGRFMYLGMYDVVANRGYEVLEDAGAIGGHHESSFGVDEPSTVNRALAWIDSLAPGERFFLTYLPVAGHHPYDTPEPGPFPEQSDSDRYQNALHYADAAFGSLIEGLRERGLYDRTLFVIFGDHGQAFGQHEGNYGHSLFLYDENIHVPYLIAAPGLINEQVRVTRTISLIDTAPTILDLVGLPSPAGYQGKTALEAEPRMALFFTDYSLSLMGLRDGCWKYIYEMDTGRSKLFDLCEDGSELKDLSTFYPERVAAYRARLKRWSSAQKALIVNRWSGP
ncbi:MAG: sulfatase-like hydrolase/transferase [Acidobacteriota bacterium]